MTRRRYISGVLLLLVVLGGGAMIRAAGIHIGNQRFTVTPVVFDAAAGAQTVVPEAAGIVPVTLWGRVSAPDGTAIAGAMITAGDGQALYRKTVFSDAQGRYRLTATLPRDIHLRARAPMFSDNSRSLSLGTGGRRQSDFTLAPLRDPDILAEAATASAHAALLDWPDDAVGKTFVSQCHFCHQIGNALTRAPRDRAGWAEVVDRMEGYLVLLTNRDIRTIVDTLDATFTGSQIPALQTADYSPELARASIEEWMAGDGYSFIHDAEIGADGRLYGVDEGHDVIWILDRKTRKLEKVPFPGSDLPTGGLFSGLALPIGIFTGQHGPHSLAEDRDGRFWITNALSSTLMSFDTATRQFRVYAIGRDALYPHTIRIDRAGIIWFTIAGSNQVGRFDPASGAFTLIDLPSNGFSRWISDAFLPLILKIAALKPRGNLHIALSHYKLTGLGREVLNMPYGIDVNPADGSIWYSKLYADRIGRIEPDTLEITEIATPLEGPRRLRFGADGTLWIPFFDESAVMRFDPATETFTAYDLPLLSDGEYETPYALNVHPETGDVWITSNLSDRVFRFDPGTGNFTSYPSPTRVTFLRDLVFAENGAVCSSQSNLPAYAIETGAPSFICIDF